MSQQDEQLLDLIDSYLNNSMSEAERYAFEEKMASDKEFAAKVNEVKITNEAIYYASLAELKKRIGRDVKTIKYKPSFNWKKTLYISIGSLALISGIIYTIANSTKPKLNIRTELTDTIKETEKKYFDDNTGLPTSPKAPTMKSSQLSLPANQQRIDTILPDNKSIREPALSGTNTVKIIEDPQTKTAAKKDSDSIIERKAAPMSNETKILCNKSFTITTEASCKQKETGSILILSDGAYQYTFNVNDYSASGSKGFFQNIGAGDYDVMITYGKECTFTKKATVTEKWCAMNSSFSFNPDYNEKWVLKYEQGASGTFTIFDKGGKEIYGNTFGAGNEEWNGTDKNGGMVQMGIYIAIIDYSDGRKEKVELTIVR